MTIWLKNRNKLIFAAIFMQLSLLIWIAGEREWIRKTGTVIYLRTAPVDPRDIFRGDYVQLQYEITNPIGTEIPEQIPQTKHKEVFLILDIKADGVAQLVKIQTEKPEALFVKGNLDTGRRLGVNSTLITLGIEKYFIEQGQGKVIEDKRGYRDTWQTALEMEVALASSGTAVIMGHRWSKIGTKLEVLNQTANSNLVNTNDLVGSLNSVSPRLKISLRNQSDVSINLLDSQDHCAFTLLEQTNKGTTQPLPTPNRLCSEHTKWESHVLTPDAVYSIEIDLTDELWYVQEDGTNLEIGALQNPAQRYRWRYTVEEDVIGKFEKLENVLTNSLRTTQFNARGKID